MPSCNTGKWQHCHRISFFFLTGYLCMACIEEQQYCCKIYFKRNMSKTMISMVPRPNSTSVSCTKI